MLGGRVQTRLDVIALDRANLNAYALTKEGVRRYGS